MPQVTLWEVSYRCRDEHHRLESRCAWLRAVHLHYAPWGAAESIMLIRLLHICMIVSLHACQICSPPGDREADGNHVDVAEAVGCIVHAVLKLSILPAVRSSSRPVISIEWPDQTLCRRFIGEAADLSQDVLVLRVCSHEKHSISWPAWTRACLALLLSRSQLTAWQDVTWAVHLIKFATLLFRGESMCLFDRHYRLDREGFPTV